MRSYKHIFLCSVLAIGTVSLGGCAPKVRKAEIVEPKTEEKPLPQPKLKMTLHKKSLLAGPNRKEQFCYFDVEDEGNSSEYRLVRHSISNKMECLGSFVRNGMNLLCYADKPDEIYLVNFYGFYPGEPVDYYIISVDDKRISKLHIIPNTMEVVKKNGYKLAAEISSPDGYSFIFHGSGFEPFELVTGVAMTDGIEEGFVLTTDEDGRLTFTISPAWNKEPGGDATIEMRGQKGFISMNYPWGVTYLHWAESQVYDGGK